MPSDLRITVFRGCAFFKIHRLEDRVLSVLLLDGKSRLLDFSLALQCGVFGFLFSSSAALVGEEVELDKHRRFSLARPLPAWTMISTTYILADKQILVQRSGQRVLTQAHIFLAGRGCVTVEVDRAVRLFRNRLP